MAESIEAFAARVNRAAARAKTGSRFGTHKVFIGEIARALKVRDRAAFGRSLAEANRRGLVALARADLVAAMPAHLVAASEVRHLEATFHFVEDATGGAGRSKTRAGRSRELGTKGRPGQRGGGGAG